MDAEGYLFLSINGGDVISVPVRVDTGKIIMELWYGGLDASNCDPSNRALIEGVLTWMLDQHALSTPSR